MYDKGGLSKNKFMKREGLARTSIQRGEVEQEYEKQGWEFSHLISEQIARFLSKN